MRQKSGTGKAPAEQVIKDIRRATRKQYGAEEKIRIVLAADNSREAMGTTSHRVRCERCAAARRAGWCLRAGCESGRNSRPRH